MTELSGTLDGIGLFPLLNFLSSLKARGRLAITDRELSGALHLADGKLVGATFGDDTGDVALDAIGLALGHGRFTFEDGDGDQPVNLKMEGRALQEHLEQLATERERVMAVVPSLDATPTVTMSDGPDDQALQLDRGTLRLLLGANGQRSVLDLARDGGLLPTLKHLVTLHELGLVDVVDQQRAPAPPITDETIVLTRPSADMPERPAPTQPAPEAVREAADTSSHPRRPWWQGEGP